MTTNAGKFLPDQPAGAYECPNCHAPYVLGVTSLRDYFAAHALGGMLANDRAVKIFFAAEPDGGGAFAAQTAYGWADAMLKEREKP